MIKAIKINGWKLAGFLLYLHYQIDDMNRINRYRQFRKKVKDIGRVLTAAAICPLGSGAVKGSKSAGYKFQQLPRKWQDKVNARIHIAINNYHRPVVKGRNGEWYSAYDMDLAMMGYSI